MAPPMMPRPITPTTGFIFLSLDGARLHQFPRPGKRAAMSRPRSGRRMSRVESRRRMQDRVSLGATMPDHKAMTAVPRGLIHVPVTPLTADNTVDLATFERVVDFLVKQNAAALCVNLHLAESLNLTLDERKQLAECAIDVAAGRVPVIVHVSTPGTDQAIELARHAEGIGADCVMAIAPYYWKPSQEALFDHFAAIMRATALPFIAYNSPTIMDGTGILPETLVKLMQSFPQMIGLKEASHNWEKYLALGRAARSVRDDFGLFVGTEWMVPSLTLGGTAC